MLARRLLGLHRGQERRRGETPKALVYLNNGICLAVAAGAIALIAYQAMAHHGQTNSGTQPYVRHEHAEIMRHDHHEDDAELD